MSARNKFPKLHTNDLEVDQFANFWDTVNIREDLNVTGLTKLTNTHINGDLTVHGCIVGDADSIPATSASERRLEAYQRRVKAALHQYRVTPPDHVNNGDEELYPNKIGNYHKGLPHDSLGEVDPDAYATFLAAVQDPTKWDLVIMGGPRKLINPLGGVAFSIEGHDSHAVTIPPAPTLASAQQASEGVEDYWMALMRDVRFDQYSINPLAAQAIDDLNSMSDFRGPKDGGVVTDQTLFRGSAFGCTVGPYLSQFFYLTCPLGAATISQKNIVPVANIDFMTDWTTFLSIQNGNLPVATTTYNPTPRYMINGRDLSHWVHIDALEQAYLQAGLILYSLGCPFNPGNPYLTGHQNQDGFVTFGPTYYLTLLGEVANRALKAVWHKKWYVHKRLRPEAYGGLVDRHMNNQAVYPIHSEMLNSQALVEVFNKNGTYLLPQAFPEGSPTHPSYAAGHATVGGACATALKAIFDTENFVIPNPVQPDATGANLVPYIGPQLTALGEINKIANNVALGRNIAGVHWRTDGDEGIKLGEEITISILRDHKKTYHNAENFGGFTFRKFDGTIVTI